MTAVKGGWPGAATQQQRPAPKWERTPWWHWRSLVLRKTWRVFDPGVSWADGVRRSNDWTYRSSKQRARQVLQESCDPSYRRHMADAEGPTQQGIRNAHFSGGKGIN